MSQFKVTSEQSRLFINAIEILEVEQSPEHLRALAQTALERVPFTNIMMLVRPRRSPTHEEIIDDMLSLRGGPCGHYNPFMNEVLCHLGFDSSLVPAWMNGKLSHMAIVVNLDREKWWLDFGNGHPYLSPICLGSNEVQCHAGLSYRITSDSGEFHRLEHRLPGQESFTENYRFTTQRVTFSFFDDMVEAHYTMPGFGPFLDGVRFIRFPEGEMLAIRDKELLRTSCGEMEKTAIKDVSEMERIVTTEFDQATYPLRQGLEVLGWS
jgi:arylamine N-acetyltransferase